MRIKTKIMLEKLDKIQELLKIPNVDKNPELSIANMKILNLLVSLRSDIEQLNLCSVSCSKIYEGLKVVDRDKNTGTVKQCFDTHNVWVVYDVGGSGFYCIEKDCKDYDPLYYS